MEGPLDRTADLRVDVHGWLSATGRGTFTAILLGLSGHDPEHVRPDQAEDRLADIAAAGARVPHPFRTAEQLLGRCESTGTPISEVMPANERAWRGEDEIRQQLLHIRAVMEDCKDSGLRRTGPLPGGLNVAPAPGTGTGTGTGACAPRTRTGTRASGRSG